jgi:CDP-paratose synthetase
MNILILGANGYLGSKIVHSLISREVSLICTKRAKSNLTRLNDLVNDERVKFIPATVESIESALQYTYFDWVLNIACNYGRSDGLYDSVIESNIEFPLKILDKAVEKGTTKFLTIGTGLPERFNMYSFSKKMFSEFGKFYAEKHGIDFYNMRLEMFYGSDEPKERFIPNLIFNMLLGNEINVTIGTQHRDIISVNDVKDAIMIIVDKKLRGRGYFEIPVGTGIAPSISEIVDFIWDETGRKSVVRKGSVPMRKDEPDSVADTKILEETNEWHPVFWKDGIRQMICDIQEQIDNGNVYV